MQILDLLSNYNLEVERKGNLHVLLCPFHSENTPSFVAYPETNSFYCFGCHTGGGIVEFISLYEGLSKKQVRARLQSINELKGRLRCLENKSELDYTKETQLLIAKLFYLYVTPERLPLLFPIMQQVDEQLKEKNFTFRTGIKFVENIRTQLYKLLEETNATRT